LIELIIVGVLGVVDLLCMMIMRFMKNHCIVLTAALEWSVSKYDMVDDCTAGILSPDGNNGSINL
jgi:hypothetical protein